MKIIVLKITKYKENDCIVDGINETGLFSFLVKGMLNPKSKNAFLNNVLTIFEGQFNEGNYKYPVLKNADLIFSPRQVNETLEYMEAISLLNEIVIKLLQPDEYYKTYYLLNNALRSLHDHSDIRLIETIFIANILKIIGFELEVNKCIYCGGKKDIVAFSFAEGGFICAKCKEEEIKSDLNKNEMLLLRYVCNKNIFDNLKADNYSTYEKEMVLKKLIEFIYDACSIRIKSLSITEASNR